MFSKTVRRSLLMVFVMALFLLPGAAQSGTFDPAGERTIPSLNRFQEQAHSWAWLVWGSFSGLWEKEGVSIDPNGTPGQGGAGTGGTGTATGGTTSGDGGASIDPSGKP